MTLQLNHENLSEMLDRINGWIENCDTKVSIILSVYGVFAGILLTTDYVTRFIDIFRLALNKSIFPDIIIWGEILIPLLVVLCGLFHLFSSLLAKIKLEEFQQRGVRADSVIFFSTIAKNKSLSDYQSKLQNYSNDEIIEDFISQIYICSLICERKFSQYRKGLIKISMGSFLLLLGLITVLIQSH